MIKKIFVGAICGIALINMLSNVNPNMTPYTLPEENKEINSDVINKEECIEKPILKIKKTKMNDYKIEGLSLEKLKIKSGQCLILHKAKRLNISYEKQYNEITSD